MQIKVTYNSDLITTRGTVGVYLALAKNKFPLSNATTCFSSFLFFNFDRKTTRFHLCALTRYFFNYFTNLNFGYCKETSKQKVLLCSISYEVTLSCRQPYTIRLFFRSFMMKKNLMSVVPMQSAFVTLAFLHISVCKKIVWVVYTWNINKNANVASKYSRKC